MLKPACPHCLRFYRPKTNGFAFVEGMPEGSHIKPGREEPEGWKPYKLWIGDLWECPGCKAQVLTGALRPVAEHYQDEFTGLVARTGATLQINDC